MFLFSSHFYTGKSTILFVFSKVAWSGGSFNHYTSKVVATALKKGFLTSHVQLLRKDYTVMI
jgi:hypothetical protein